MVELPAVGPLEFPCSQSLDEFLGQKPKTKLGRCGDLTCEQCGARELIIEVGATARVLEEEGGQAIVASFHSFPKAVPPDELHAVLQPRMNSAIALLQSKYVGGLEARWTLEQDLVGGANAHVLTWGPSTPKIGALRRTFVACGLGRDVNLVAVNQPLTMACYTTKIPLVVFALGHRGRTLALDYALRLNGGRFARATEAFYDGNETVDLELFAAPYLEGVTSWAASWPYFSDKLPPGLTSELADAHAVLAGDACQSPPQESDVHGDIGWLLGPEVFELPDP